MSDVAEIGEELERNGFEAERYGPRTLAIKAAPAGFGGQGSWGGCWRRCSG